MPQYQIDQIKATLQKSADIIRGKQGELTEIDSIIGDGDLGISMGKGVAALAQTVEAYHAEAVGPLFVQCGTAFNRAAPSTMGTLTSMALISLGQAWKEKTELTEQDVVHAPMILADTIARFGKAKQGNKTILDALYPFANTLEAEYGKTGDFARAYEAAEAAAKHGMEATKGMIATVGRARWIGERTQNVLDGGALLCVYLIEGLRA